MRSRSSLILVALAAALILLAACGGSDSSSGTPQGDEETGRVDWATRSVDLDLPPGWAVEFCEGAGPFLCVSRDGAAAGVVELLDFHRAGFDGDLTAYAREVYEAIADDRSAGCGDGYRFETDDTVPATVAGREGVRYSFTGHMPDGRPAERGVGYVVLIGDVLYTIGANAYEADGCVGTEGGEFTVDVLRDFEPLMAAIAIASAVPGGGGDGTVTGYLRGIDPSGAIHVDPARVLSGQEALDAARHAGVIGPDEELESDFFVLDPDDATFELRLDDGTHVELLDCTSGCRLVTVPVPDFLQGTVRPYGGDGAIVAVTLAGGEAVAVVEQYLP